ncbi:hypothetical protein COLO4_22533 [Corchorus olitorius]|uniref:Uncharacterized protein n=1 Tax=Corchorus olitorius TaxID=93759 RepID=A0A1R3ILQ1_9ROSI|nr:hypothetical protein COLO4_22533 [Corchorus olitorius]
MSGRDQIPETAEKFAGKVESVVMSIQAVME